MGETFAGFVLDHILDHCVGESGRVDVVDVWCVQASPPLDCVGNEDLLEDIGRGTRWLLVIACDDDEGPGVKLSGEDCLRDL